jgi:hypothetical protein
MGEDNKNKFSENAEDLKNETKETVNQVKETIKNVDIKKDTKETTSFLKDMLSNPFETVEKVSKGEENVLTKDIIIMVIFIVASLAYGIINLINYGRYSSFGSNTKDIISAILNPVIYILVPALVCYVVIKVSKKEKKSLITVISTLVVAAVPTILTYFVDIINLLLRGIFSYINIITSPINTTLAAISLLLTYFGMKGLFEEEDNMKFIKTYVIIKFISSLILYIL